MKTGVRFVSGKCCQHADSSYSDFLFLGPVKKITPVSAGEPARISSSQRQLQVRGGLMRPIKT